MRAKRPSLAAIEGYRHAETVARFCGEWDVPLAESRELFADLVRYLWLADGTEQRFQPVLILDIMWHTFLLFTRDYTKWCERTFGHVIHHQPATDAEKKHWDRMWRDEPERARARYARVLNKELAIVNAALGERVMLRWYVTYHRRYTPRFLNRKRLHYAVPEIRFPRALLEKARGA